MLLLHHYRNQGGWFRLQRRIGKYNTQGPCVHVCLLVLRYVVHVYVSFCFCSVRDNQPQGQLPIPPPQGGDQQDPPHPPNPLDGQQNPNDNTQTEADHEVHNVKYIPLGLFIQLSLGRHRNLFILDKSEMSALGINTEYMHFAVKLFRVVQNLSVVISPITLQCKSHDTHDLRLLLSVSVF